jgi:hypothetical protein
MRDTIVENLSSIPFELVVEPWAQVFQVPPDRSVTLSYPEEPPPRIDVSFLGPSSMTVNVMSSAIVIRLPNGQELRFNSDPGN